MIAIEKYIFQLWFQYVFSDLDIDVEFYSKIRQRRDLNSRGHSPLAFKTNSLTTRTLCHPWWFLTAIIICSVWCISFEIQTCILIDIYIFIEAFRMKHSVIYNHHIFDRKIIIFSCQRPENIYFIYTFNVLLLDWGYVHIYITKIDMQRSWTSDEIINWHYDIMSLLI